MLGDSKLILPHAKQLFGAFFRVHSNYQTTLLSSTSFQVLVFSKPLASTNGKQLVWLVTWFNLLAENGSGTIPCKTAEDRQKLRKDTRRNTAV